MNIDTLTVDIKVGNIEEAKQAFDALALAAENAQLKLKALEDYCTLLGL